ncbi:MAG: hypothetical protein K1X67_14625 [Fimbriimonadaceae bacterium]|nr:hypothetical protein [Fimbriimonadaceae bacterium]
MFLLVVAAASVSAQPGKSRTTRTLGLLPYLEQANVRSLQDVFVTELNIRLKGTNARLLTPRDTLARFRKSNIDSRQYVAKPKSFTGSDEELGALIAWIRAPKAEKGKQAKVVINLIDTNTGDVVWADEVRGCCQEAQRRGQPSSGRRHQTASRRPTERSDKATVTAVKIGPYTESVTGGQAPIRFYVENILAGLRSDSFTRDYARRYAES